MATGAVSFRADIPALYHHFRDDAMELATLVAEPALSSREFAEVARGHRADIIVELEDDSSGGLRVDGDVKENVTEEGRGG